MKVIITGSAGFIGFHLAMLLLKQGFEVYGYDGMTNYYDVELKRKRNELLKKNKNFLFTNGMLQDENKFENLACKINPDIIVHLAAQAGVLYSLENPRSYIESNIIGTFNVMEAARKQKVKHLLMASTSSVYGANLNMPFNEKQKTETQLTLYAATKKANESMAHSYSHLWKIPTTMFRFFTVYGPWGRPDMALFKFVSAIINNKPIDVYNNGEMYRDFTYVDDLVKSISLLINNIPRQPSNQTDIEKDNISTVAPFRIINIGNSKKERLIDFINEIENILGKKSIRNYMPMQKGDVPATWADSTILKKLTGYSPQTNLNDGISNFVKWYKEYYKI